MVNGLYETGSLSPSVCGCGVENLRSLNVAKFRIVNAVAVYITVFAMSICHILIIISRYYCFA